MINASAANLDQQELLRQVQYYFHEKPHIFPDMVKGRLEYQFIQKIFAGEDPFLDEDLVRLPVLLSEYQYTISSIPNEIKEKIWDSCRSLEDIQNLFEYGFKRNEENWGFGCDVMISPTGILELVKMSKINFHADVIREKRIFNFAIWGKCTYNKTEYEKHYIFFKEFEHTEIAGLTIKEFMTKIIRSLKRLLNRIEIVSEKPFQYRL